MTRQEIRRRCAVMCGEVFGTPGHDNPVNYDLWIDTATDDVSRVVGHFYGTETANIVSGTSKYCAPEFYRLDAVYYVNDEGKDVQLTPMTPLDLDKLSDSWRNDPSSLPTAYATRGLRDIILYPTPNFSRMDGLVFEGFLAPGSAGSGGGSRWPNPTDQCPLPMRAHVAVLFRAAYYRNVELPGSDPVKTELYDLNFRTQKGYLEREAATYTAAIQHRDVPDTGYTSPAFNPLDL